jgi:hypothetical protein
MVARLAGMMAGLGIDGISFGLKTIKAAPREALKRLVGFGDSIEVGNVVEVSTFDPKTSEWSIDPEPKRVFRIFKTDEGAHIQYRTPDDGPLYSNYCVPVARALHTDAYRLRFRKLCQGEVTRWFERSRWFPDGTHRLETIGTVTIEKGVPVRVTRSGKHTHMALVVEVAGQLSGYDLTVARKYNDSAKLEAAVTKAARKQPPEA